MRISATVSSHDEFGRASRIAETFDPALLYQIIQGLLTNCLLEVDERDKTFVEHFPETAQAIIVDIRNQIRANAVQAVSGDLEGIADS